MVICKFFLQGTCKYGDYCKFEHQLNENFNSIQNKSTSVLRQSHFSNAPQIKQVGSTNVDINSLVKSVVNDMTVAEKGGQWLLSCYAPYKEKPAFPGFEDHSSEEIRLGYYEALKNGTLEQYKQQVQVLLQQAIQRLKLLQSPSPDIVNMLKAIYNTPPSSHAGIFGSNTATSNVYISSTNVSNSFNQQPSTQQSGNSIFAQANQILNIQPSTLKGPTSIFGNAPQNLTNFGGSNSQTPFGNQIQSQGTGTNIFNQGNSNLARGGSVFGGAINTQTTNSQFSNVQSHTNSIFGGQANNSMHQNVSALFGTQPQTQTNNLFVIPSANTTSHIAGPFRSQNVNTSFSQTVPQTMFGSSPMLSTAQASPNTFGNVFSQPQNQPFGNTTNLLLNTQQIAGSSIFSQQNANPSFIQQGKSSTEIQSQSNIFGNKPAINYSLTRSQAGPIDPNIYSKLEDLTEEEIKWFESVDIGVGNIPEKPPTYEMCFKT